MSVNVKRFACAPEAVFAVLADGWLYPTWVVGASRMRDVDASWPAPGAQLHHSFGVWPALLDDATTSLEWDPPRRAAFRAKGRPVGEARVLIDVSPRGSGCVVRLEEQAVRGPGALIPRAVMDVPLYLRNVETLRRLAFLAEGHARD
jgi:hypothetical protein